MKIQSKVEELELLNRLLRIKLDASVGLCKPNMTKEVKSFGPNLYDMVKTV